MSYDTAETGLVKVEGCHLDLNKEIPGVRVTLHKYRSDGRAVPPFKVTAGAARELIQALRYVLRDTLQGGY